jgi:arsenite transporter
VRVLSPAALAPAVRPYATTALFVGAIAAGAALGAISPAAGAVVGRATDPLILSLVALLFLTVRLDGLSALRRMPRVALLAVVVNFVVVPVLAVALTTLLLPDLDLRLGVLLYCLAPCTDWFLGFTRIAGGDTAVGAALIPLQMTLQLALFPVWLALFAGERGVAADASFASAGPALLTWFVLPAGIAVAARVLLDRMLPRAGRRVVATADRAVPLVIAAVILALFAANVGTILADPGAFAGVLVVVFLFFVATFAIGELVSRAFRLRFPERALLTMTTSARNAPLMLAVTAVALPGRPVVAAALVLGMLVEFPHLTAVAQLLRPQWTR